MALRLEQFALNPLQYMATSDGWLDPTLGPSWDVRLSDIRDAGFTAVQTEVPEEMTPTEYAQALDRYGLRPGPGYIDLMWDEDPDARAEHEATARQTTRDNLEAGEPLLFLSLGMERDAPRIARPAVGHQADPDRLARISDYVGSVAAAVAAEGGVAALHPHIGSWVETEAEARYVLDRNDPKTLRFGPDAGHLAWSGADPRRLILEYGDRVAGVHIKDFDAELARRSRDEGLGYRETVQAGLWTEPGKGDAAIDDVLDALPVDFDGWVVVEVDRGSVPPSESVRDSGAWLQAHLARV
ncbi:MAG: sugar phosphate isomerase/epimerase [Curtobacterium sp.]